MKTQETVFQADGDTPADMGAVQGRIRMDIVHELINHGEADTDLVLHHYGSLQGLKLFAVGSDDVMDIPPKIRSPRMSDYLARDVPELVIAARKKQGIPFAVHEENVHSFFVLPNRREPPSILMFGDGDTRAQLITALVKSANVVDTFTTGKRKDTAVLLYAVDDRRFGIYKKLETLPVFHDPVHGEAVYTASAQTEFTLVLQRIWEESKLFRAHPPARDYRPNRVIIIDNLTKLDVHTSLFIQHLLRNPDPKIHVVGGAPYTDPYAIFGLRTAPDVNRYPFTWRLFGHTRGAPHKVSRLPEFRHMDLEHLPPHQFAYSVQTPDGQKMPQFCWILRDK